MNKIKRFIFVSTMFGAPWGGSEELWSQAALRLQEQEHEVLAVVTWWPELSPKVTIPIEQIKRAFTDII